MHRKLNFRITRSSNTDSELLLRVWIGSLIVIVAAYGYIIMIGQFGKLWNVTVFNIHFYIVLFVLWVIGVGWWQKHKENFSIKELLCFAAFVPYTRQQSLVRLGLAQECTII